MQKEVRSLSYCLLLGVDKGSTFIKGLWEVVGLPGSPSLCREDTGQVQGELRPQESEGEIFRRGGDSLQDSRDGGLLGFPRPPSNVFLHFSQGHPALEFSLTLG